MQKVVMMPEDEFVAALCARLRIACPAYLPRFQRERGVAQHCSDQYSGGSTICGHRLLRANGAADKRGTRGRGRPAAQFLSGLARGVVASCLPSTVGGPRATRRGVGQVDPEKEQEDRRA